MDFQPKLVETLHYHVWTDALHMRALANQANNRWDRGTYVRAVLMNAWTALEMACNDALDVTDIGYSFRKHLDRSLEDKGGPKLDWSQGTWKEVSELLVLRKQFVHEGISEQHRFADMKLAIRITDICRAAIKAVYAQAGKSVPVWVEDNSDPGFQEESGFGIGNLTVTGPGVDPSAGDTIRIAIVYKDQERTTQNCAAGTDYKPLMDEVIRLTRVPISAVRAYRGAQLLEERDLLMRGN